MTPKLVATLDYIRAYQAANGYAPTMQEAADKLGVSKVTIWERVGRLEKAGAIKRLRRRHHGIRVPRRDELADLRAENQRLRERLAEAK